MNDPLFNDLSKRLKEINSKIEVTVYDAKGKTDREDTSNQGGVENLQEGNASLERP